MIMSIEPETITIRKAISNDAYQLASLAARVFAETYGQAIPNEVMFPYLLRQFSATALTADLTRRETHYLVAEYGSKIVGYVKLEETTEPACVTYERPLELVKLYIDLDQQRQGIGSALLDEALMFATHLGYPAVWLCVWENNPPALDFYENAGFERCGTTEMLVDGVVFHDIVFVKPLGE